MNPFFPPPFFYDDEGEGKTFRTKKKEVGGADKKLGASELKRERERGVTHGVFLGRREEGRGV